MVGPVAVAEPAAEDFRSDSTQPTPGLKLEAGTAGRTAWSGFGFHTGGCASSRARLRVFFSFGFFRRLARSRPREAEFGGPSVGDAYELGVPCSAVLTRRILGRSVTSVGQILFCLDVSIPSPVLGRCVPFGTNVDGLIIVAISRTAKMLTTTQQPHRKMS